MAMQMNAPTFPLFPNLPTELRLQIWRNALPGRIQPNLFLWKRGCWAIRLLTEHEYEYEPGNDEANLILEFRHDLLDPARFDNPLALTNNEARQVALSWAAQNGFELQQSNIGDYPILRRTFQATWDAVFVPAHSWEIFLNEAIYRPFEPDLIERTFTNRSEVYYLAIPEILLYQNAPTRLEDIFESFPFLKALYVVLEADSSTTSYREQGKPWPRNINEGRDWEMVWTGNQEGAEDKWVVPDEETQLINGTLRIRLMNAAEELQRGLVDYQFPDFRIRIV